MTETVAVDTHGVMRRFSVVLLLFVSGCPIAHEPTRLEAFLTEVDRLVCEQSIRCAAPTSVNVWREAAPELDCHDVLTYLAPTRVDEALVVFDATLADDCLERLASSCASSIAAVCPGVLTGLGTDGARCGSDLECTADRFCAFPDDACSGTCQPRPTGGPCEAGCVLCDDHGTGDFECVGPVPVVEVGPGEPCATRDRISVCPPMHYCSEICRPFPAEGEACGEVWPVCAPGLGCDAGICRRARVAARGEACDDILGFCDRFHGEECVEGRCTPIAVCSPTWVAIDCDDDEECGFVSGECEPRRATPLCPR